MSIDSHNLTARDLRNFALIMGGMIVLMFGLVIPWLWSSGFPTWPWIVAAILGLCGLIMPKTLGPLHGIWMKLGAVLGWINNRLILGFIFYLFVLPIGILMRLVGRDPMARRFEPTATTYRIERTPPSSNSMEKPF